MYEIDIKIIESDLSRKLATIIIKHIRSQRIENKKITIQEMKNNIRNKKIFKIFSSSCCYSDDLYDFEGEVIYFISNISPFVKKYHLYFTFNGKCECIDNIEMFFNKIKVIEKELFIYRDNIEEKEYRLYGEMTKNRLYEKEEILQEHEKYNMKNIVDLFPSIKETDNIEEISENILINYFQINDREASFYYDLASDIKYYFKEHLKND